LVDYTLAPSFSQYKSCCLAITVMQHMTALKGRGMRCFNTRVEEAHYTTEYMQYDLMLLAKMLQ